MVTISTTCFRTQKF